jgi:hypothetical protein
MLGALGCGVALLAVVSGCARVGQGGGAAAAPSHGEPTVLRAATHVLAVAASDRFVYVRSTAGLALWDRTFARWEPPAPHVHEALAAAGVGPASIDAEVRAWPMMVDPVEEAVWIGARNGVALYRPRVGQVTHVPMVGDVEAIRFVRDDDAAWVRAGGTWTRVSRAGFAMPAIGGPPSGRLQPVFDLEAAFRAFPALRAQLPFLLRDAERRAPSARSASAIDRGGPVTTGTFAPGRPSELFVGTWGDGLFAVDARLLQARSMPTGLPGDDVEALVALGDGAWVVTGASPSLASDGRATTLAFVRAGGTRATEATVSWPEVRAIGVADARDVGVGAVARRAALAVRAGEVWVARGAELQRVRSRASSAPTVWRVEAAWPGAVATSVLTTLDGVWVGTSDGLAWLPAPLTEREDATTDVSLQRIGAGRQEVRALARIDTLLIVGTRAGVFARSVRVGDDASVTGGVLARVLLERPVTTLTAHDSLLVMLGPDGVWWRLGRAAGGDVTRLSLGGLLDVGAPLVAAVADAQSVWIATRDAVVSVARGPDGRPLEGSARRVAASAWRVGDVTSLALQDGVAWVGTRDGLVRVRRLTGGGLE